MANDFPQVAILDTPEGETALLTAIINARPVGMGKHWAMVSILLFLDQILGEGRVTGEEVWRKLRTLYDLDLLDEDSDLNTPNDPLVTEDDPSSSTSARKRRRRLSATTAADTSITNEQSNIKSDFNLLEKRAFQEEFAKRRKSSHSPSPSPLSSSMPLEPDGDDEEEDKDEEQDEDVEEEEGEDTVMAEDDDDEEEADEDEEEEEEEEEETKPVRGRRSSSRGQAAKRGSTLPGTRGGTKRGGKNRGSNKSRKNKSDDDDGISETASTLSALSEDGEAGPSHKRTNSDADLQDGDVTEEVDEDDVGARDEAQAEEVDDSGPEPDIGPDDTPFKTPKGIKKRQTNRKTRKASTPGSAEEAEGEEAAEDDLSEEAKSPTSTRKGLGGSKGARRPPSAVTKPKKGISEEVKPAPRTSTAATYGSSKRKLDKDGRRK